MAKDSFDSLFTTDFSEPISFNTEALLEPRCMVNNPIKRYGGEVTEEMGPHTVYLVPDPADLQGRKDTQPPYNTFTRMFIHDSVYGKNLMKLKDYWAHKLKNFDEQFDPQKVMNGYLTWEDCTKEMSRSTSGLTPGTPVVCSDDDGEAGGSTAPLLPSPATPEAPRLSKGIPSHSEGQAEASTRLPWTSKPLTSLPHITNEIPCSTSRLTPVTPVVCSDDDGEAGGSTAPLSPSHSEGQAEASTRLPRTSKPLTSHPHITNETPCSTSGLPPVTVSDDDIFNNADSSTDKPRCFNHRGRMAYTSIEKLKILAYIHKEKLHDKVNGNIIWKKMEEEEVCPGRTWQSMKEHFRKSLSHQLDKFPKHLSDVFSHPPKQHGFYKKPAPPLPEQQSSSSSDRNIDMDNAPMDERDDRVKCTKARDGCGRSFAQRITRDERTSGSTEEGTHKSSSHVSKQKTMKESIKGGNYFVPLSAQTDERRENENQNTQVTIPAPEQVRAEGGRESNMEGADQTTQANNQETTPAPQQVRTEGGRERGIREGADQTSQVCTQKENHSDSVKECRHFILPPVLTEEKEESENSSSPVNVPVPERDRTEEEGRGKQESRDDNDNTPSCMLHSDTEDMDIELLLNECKKTEHSKSHLNTGSEEVNVCETKEGELDRVSPSILTSSDAFFMDMHSVLQESQGFSVYHLDPLSGEKEKEDMRSGKNSKEKYFRDEQQEPDSSIQILEEPEGWSKSDKRAQSQLLKSSKSSTNQMDSFSTLSTQNDQETLLAKDNEDDLLLEEIFQTSEYLTSSIPDCAHSALNAKATMEELYKAVEPLPGPSDTISSSQDFICSTNIFQHDKSAAPLSRPTLPQGGNEVNKESKERKEDTEESQGKETGGMMEDCVRSATNDKATQEELQKASHPLSISMKKKQGQKKEQKNQDHGPDNEDREKQDEEIRKIQEVKELEVEAAEEEEEAVIVGKNGEELDDVGKVDEKDENEEEEKANKESEDKDDEKETEEIPVNEVSNSSKHSTSSLIQDCEISAINDKAIHGEFQMAVHPSSILSRERQGQEEEPEYQDQALENEDGEQGEEQEMEEGESAEDEEGEVVVEDRRVVKEFNDDEEEEQEVEKVSRGIEERKHEEEEDEFSDNDISDFSKRSTSSMIQDAGRSAVSDEANLEEYQESVHPLSPLAKKKQEQEKKQENQEQKLDNEDGREQVEEMEEVLEVEAAEEEEEIVEERTDEGGLNDYDNEEEEEEEEDEVEVGRGSEERKDEEEENKIADSEISDYSRHSASSMIQEHVKSAVKGKAIQRDLQQAAHPSSASVRRRQGQEKEQGNQEFEYEDGEEQGEEILLDKEMEEALEVEGAIEEDAIVTEDEEESNNDAEVEEERHDEEEFEIRKRNQEKSKQRPLYFSSRLPMKRRRMELCHTSSHITNDGPSTSQAEPRQHTQEEPALSYLRAPPGSRSYSSRSLTCSWKSTDHSTPQRQKAGSYTVMEDLAIINYIVKENAYDRVGGRALWQEMATNFPTGRTWQSLKERFRKRIMTNLHLYTAHGLGKKTIQKLEGKTTIDTGYGKMQNQRQHQQEEELLLQHPTAQSGSSYRQGRRTKGLSSSESEDKRTFDPQQRRSRMESSSCSEKNITNYKHSRRTKGLSSSESEDERTFDPQQRRSRMESSSSSEKNITNYKHSRRTKEVGSSESEDERVFDPLQRRSRMKSRSCSEKNITNYKHSRRTKGLSFSESEDERTFNPQQRKSRIESRSCREKKLTNKESSYFKVKRHKNISQQTESEDSDSEKSLLAGNSQSRSAGQPRHAKGKHQHQDHAKMERSEATKRRKKGTPAVSDHSQPKRGQNSVAITSKSEEYKDWKFKVLHEALGKAPHAHSKSQRSDAGSSFYSPPSSRRAMYHPLRKKCRLLDPEEMCMAPPKTSISHSSKDLPKNLLDQQRKHLRDGSTVNTKTQEQHKLQTVAERSNACDDSNNQDSVRKDSEASGTTSRHIPLLESDTDESDQGTLPDLNFSIASSPHQSKVHSTEEKEKEDISQEEDDESSGGSIALFEL